MRQKQLLRIDRIIFYLSFARTNSIFDLDWHYQHGTLWSIDIDVLKFEFTIYFQGDDLPF